MKPRYLISAACVAVGTPFLAFAIGYIGRWVLFGKWVEGVGIDPWSASSLGLYTMVLPPYSRG